MLETLWGPRAHPPVNDPPVAAARRVVTGPSQDHGQAPADSLAADDQAALRSRLGAIEERLAQLQDELERQEARTDAALARANEEPPSPDLEGGGARGWLGDDEEPLTLVHEGAVGEGTALDAEKESTPADDVEALLAYDQSLPAATDDDEIMLVDDAPPEPPAPVLVAEIPRTADDQLARRLEALEDRLDLASAGQPDLLRFVAVEEMTERLNERADAQAERVHALGAALQAAQEDTESDTLHRQMDQMREQLEQLQGTIDAEWARAKSETASLGQSLSDLGERMVNLAEQAAAGAGAGERVAALEQKVEEATTTLAGAIESQCKAPPARTAPEPAGDCESRFRALERQLEQNRDEMSDLNELHAALDAGLGALRAELAEIRTSLARLADSKADLDDRLETFLRMSLVPEGEKGRKGKKAAESTVATLSAAVQDLIGEQRLLKDTVAGLDRAADAATAAAARATMQSLSTGPLRSDVKQLNRELAEQGQALDALRRAVERLRGQPPPTVPAPATGRAAKKAVAAKRAPVAAPAGPVMGAAARAALARAAVAQADGVNKAPPTVKRVARPEKA